MGDKYRLFFVMQSILQNKTNTNWIIHHADDTKEETQESRLLYKSKRDTNNGSYKKKGYTTTMYVIVTVLEVMVIWRTKSLNGYYY